MKIECVKVVIEDDNVYAVIPRPDFGENISQYRLVMTKEIFQECYKRWIKESSDAENSTSSN